MKKILFTILFSLLTIGLFAQSRATKGLYVGPTTGGAILIDSIVQVSDSVYIYVHGSTVPFKAPRHFPSGGSGGTTYSFSNGLTESGGNVTLGGTLTSLVSLVGDSFIAQSSSSPPYSKLEIKQGSGGWLQSVDATGANGTQIAVQEDGSFYLKRTVSSTDYYLYMGDGGLYYGGDYSANYTATSLVDKNYVDTHSGGSGDVNKSDSTTVFATPTQLSDTADALRDNIHDSLDYWGINDTVALEDVAVMLADSGVVDGGYPTMTILADTAAAIRADMGSGTGDATRDDIHDSVSVAPQNYYNFSNGAIIGGTDTIAVVQKGTDTLWFKVGTGSNADWYYALRKSGSVPNSPPVASNVTFSGTKEVGQTLTGSYTYSDAESDPEGTSTFQWYRADDGSGTNEASISGATSQTYTLVSADETKYVAFEVTPVASSGTSPGNAVKSSYDGPIAAASSHTYTDNFDSYSDGDLNGQGNWVKDVGTITVSSGTIYPNSTDSIMYYYNATVTDNQYAQLYVSGNSSRFLGVLCRYNESTHSGYAAVYGNSNLFLYRLDNGTVTSLASHYTVSEPLTVKMEISGSTIKVYVNGTQDATIGDVTDATYTSGKIGLWGRNASSIRVGDNFEGGDL